MSSQESQGRESRSSTVIRTTRSSRRRWTLVVASAGFSLLAFAFVLEFAFRWLPVNEGLRGLSVNEQNPVFRFSPHREALYSKGWNFSIVNRVKTNNYGFVNGQDYDPEAKTPLLAIIGDSFVEAVMVPFDQTGVARLSQALGSTGRVYGFGTSGSSLSQYLATARYVRDTFHPVGLAVVIVGNDFDESLRKYKSEPGLHYFIEQPDGNLELMRIDRPVPWWRDLLAESALGMYLYVNLEIREVWKRLVYRPGSSMVSRPRFVGNTAAEASPARVTDSDRVIDAFLQRLPDMSGLPPSRIALAVDGIRPELYERSRLEAVADTYFAVMRTHLMDRARKRGFEVLDMQPEFIEDHHQTGRRYEYAGDNHWNGAGHEIFARALQKSSVYRVFHAAVRQN